MEGIIELKGVSFFAQERIVVKDISYGFAPSKTTALVGPSGGGKSTALKLAAGVIVPESGTVFYKGKNVAQMNRAENLAFRREGAFVFQDSALWANQNLYQILELPLRVHFPEMDKKRRDARINEVTAQVGYHKKLDARPAELSMGEQKLIAFARALLCDPNILFLDECTESLDTAAAARLIGIVKVKQARGATVLLISHDMQIVKDLADTIVVIFEGRLAMELSKEQFANDESITRYIEKWAVP